MIKIVTDRAADMTEAEATELGIHVAPLFIHFPEGQIDSAEISPDAFYDRLRDLYPTIPTTAQPSPGIFSELYDTIEDASILSIHISSGLSGTLQSATLGADGTEKDVTVFDSMTLSGGQRFQVLFAARAVAAGWSMAQIQARLEELRARTEVVFTLETLEYLAKGGRIGRVQALAGSLLKIKPVIHVAHEDGKYSTLSKARTLRRCLAQITDFLAERYGQEEVWATVLHGQLPAEADALMEMLQGELNVARSEILRVSPILGVHTGPGIVGVAVAPVALLEV